MLFFIRFLSHNCEQTELVDSKYAELFSRKYTDVCNLLWNTSKNKMMDGWMDGQMSGGFIHVIACNNSPPFLLLNSISGYDYTAFYQFSHWWTLELFRPVMKKLFWTLPYKSFCRHMFSFLLGKFLELKSLGHRISIFLVSLKKDNNDCQTFVRVYATIHSHQQCMRFPVTIQWLGSFNAQNMPP